MCDMRHVMVTSVRAIVRAYVRACVNAYVASTSQKTLYICGICVGVSGQYEYACDLHVRVCASVRVCVRARACEYVYMSC